MIGWREVELREVQAASPVFGPHPSSAGGAIQAALAHRHLLRTFAPLREPHARTTTVLRDELYASLFERPHKSLDGAILRAEFAGVGLEPLNTRQGHSGRLC